MKFRFATTKQNEDGYLKTNSMGLNMRLMCEMFNAIIIVFKEPKKAAVRYGLFGLMVLVYLMLGGK
jgi:hypothetical protein